MQYLRQTVVALSVLLAGVGCSDHPTQKELTDETIHLNNSMHTLENKTLIEEGAINPKTQFLKGKESVEISHKVPENEHVVSIKSRDNEVAKLISERDAAIRANVEIKKLGGDYKSQNLALSEKIDQLMKSQSGNESSFKEKIAASAAALLAAQQLTADKDTVIENLIKERDEAIRVTLEMKKASEGFELEKSALSAKINELMQAQNDNNSASKEKLEASASAIQEAQKLTANRDNQIAKLIAERDEAIRVTLEMKKENADFETKISQSSDENEKLLEDRKNEIDKLTNDLSHMNENIAKEAEAKQKAIDELAGLKEKLTTSTSELTTAKSLTSDKNGEIDSLTHERDDAIKVTLEMKKENEELNIKLNNLMKVQSDNKSSSQGKIAAAASALLVAQQLTADKDTEVAKLIAERDEAIKITLQMKKASADFEAQKSDLNGKMQTLMQTQSENESVSKEKISKLATALSEADKLTSDRDATILNLTKERDAAIQVSMGMQKKLEQGKKASDENAKKLVIDNIVSTFKHSKVEFKTGSAILTDKSTQLLDRVAGIMKEHTEYKYKIQGHTDSQGKKESNLKLSQARADSVKSYLVSKDVADTVLSSEGFGSLDPIADNATKEGRLQNRRVVFEIVD